MLLGTCRPMALRWKRENLLLVPLISLSEKQLPPFTTWRCPGRLIILIYDYRSPVVIKVSHNEDAIPILYDLPL